MLQATSLLSRAAYSSSMARGISNVTIIGAGLMGSGIAQVSAQSGYKVTLVDMNDELLQKSVQGIRTSLQRVAGKKFKDSPEAVEPFIQKTMANLQTSSQAAPAVKEADLVIEAIVENQATKSSLYKELDSAAPGGCVFASNTSSLSISELAAGVPARAQQFGGLHFFNPVPLMRLVEVVRAEQTSEATFEQLMEFGRSVGKTAIPCKDTPGFVVNRLLVPYLMEAVRMVERGDASPRDVDAAMKLGAGHPMGPIELADYVGLDTCKFILDGWSQKYPEEQLFRPSRLLDGLVADGKLGRKSGQGFYQWDARGNKL